MTTLDSAVLTLEALHATDRRRHRRAPLDAPVLVDNQKNWMHARCQDVSVSGLAIEATTEVAVGESVEVYFELPNGVPVEAIAEVVRCHGSRIALRFIKIGTRAMLGLRSHCRQRESRSTH